MRLGAWPNHVAHRLAVMDQLYRLCKHGRGGDDLDFIGMERRLAIDGVRGNKKLNRAVLNALNRLLAHHHVGKERIDVLRALVLQAVGHIHKRAAGNGKVIHHDAVLALHIADDFQHLGVFVVPGAHLVADGNGAAKLVRHGARALCAARIR